MRLDMGSCALETGVEEGRVTSSGGNSKCYILGDHSSHHKSLQTSRIEPKLLHIHISRKSVQLKGHQAMSIPTMPHSGELYTLT